MAPQMRDALRFQLAAPSRGAAEEVRRKLEACQEFPKAARTSGPPAWPRQPRAYPTWFHQRPVQRRVRSKLPAMTKH